MKNKKKKVIFISPITKGGPYHMYSDIVSGLKERYGDKVDVYLYNSIFDWIRMHFIRSDYIFSVIPFLFKPIFCGKFIFNPRGNFELEKKKNKLGNKLLYLANYNLGFSDNIWLVSNFLSDKLGFRDKYKNKIVIFPNFVDELDYNFGEKKYDDTKYKLLTITSFKFFRKGIGILNLGKVVNNLSLKTDKKIIWTIVGNDNSENFSKIKKDFDNIKFSENIEINWKGWVNKSEIKNELKNNDYFIYWTYLDNFPGIILEAIASKMKVLVNDFESFKYFLDKDIICESENKMLSRLLKYDFNTNKNNRFEKSKVLDDIYNFINNN